MLYVICLGIMFSYINVYCYQNPNKGLTSFPTINAHGTTMINLKNNLLTTIPNNAFDPFTAVEVINLSNNRLTEIPNVTPVASTLTRLWLNENRLTALTGSIVNSLVALEVLWLNDNSINSLPYLTGLIKLESFNAKFNAISHLHSGTFQALHCLNAIDLSDNPITSDTSLSLPPVLTKLTLLNTRYSTFTVDCHEACMLDTIKISSYLSNGPNVDEVLTYIQRYIVIDSQLDDTAINSPTAIGLFSSLILVNLKNNSLSQFPDFHGSKNTLEEIHLHHNVITAINVLRMKDITQLRILDLSYNLLTSVSEFPIATLVSLTLVNFNNNSLICDSLSFWSCSITMNTTVSSFCDISSICDDKVDDAVSSNYTLTGTTIN